MVLPTTEEPAKRVTRQSKEPSMAEVLRKSNELKKARRNKKVIEDSSDEDMKESNNESANEEIAETENTATENADKSKKTKSKSKTVIPPPPAAATSVIETPAVDKPAVVTSLKKNDDEINVDDEIEITSVIDEPRIIRKSFFLAFLSSFDFLRT